MALINKNTKLGNNTWVLCRCPMFTKEYKKFFNQYNDRIIIVYDEKTVRQQMYLVTIYEIIKIWGLDKIRTSPDKILPNQCLLFELPIPLQNDNEDDIQKYIRDNNRKWNKVDLKQYYLDNDK